VCLVRTRRVVATRVPTGRDVGSGHRGLRAAIRWHYMVRSVQRFEVSPQPLYGAAHTAFAVAVRSAEGRLVGGSAGVFDTAPRLPRCCRMRFNGRTRAGTGGLLGWFLDREEHLSARIRGGMASRGSVGSKRMRALAMRASLRIGQEYHRWAPSATRAIGNSRVWAGMVVLMPIGTVTQQGAARPALTPRPAARQAHGYHDSIEFATFAVGEKWYALPTANVSEDVDARAVQSLPRRRVGCAGISCSGGGPNSCRDLDRLLVRRHRHGLAW